LSVRTNISSKVKRPNWAFLGVFLYLCLVVLSFLFDSSSWSSAINLEKNYLGPFKDINHWLGTDGLGRDVVAGLLNGAKISFIISASTSFFAIIIGFALGYLSGYIGNDKVQVHPLLLFIYFLLSCLWIFYSYHGGNWLLYFLILVSLIIGIRYFNNTFDLLKANVYLPLDDLVIKLLEFSRSISGIFILIFCLSIFESRSIWNVILVISIVRWQGITRYVRAEFLKIKNADYIKNAEALGLPSLKILVYHLIPNIYRPILTILVYGFAVTIILEATISYIGIGLPLETVSWGTMLSESRSYFQAWWLAIFPGLMIFIVTLSLRKLVADTEDEWSYL